VGRNRARDAANETALAAAGWRVETIWECELKDPVALEQRLQAVLAAAPYSR
jgi:DNA mismatch endonuclease (patch repair protein)